MSVSELCPPRSGLEVRTCAGVPCATPATTDECAAPDYGSSPVSEKECMYGWPMYWGSVLQGPDGYVCMLDGSVSCGEGEAVARNGSRQQRKRTRQASGESTRTASLPRQHKGLRGNLSRIRHARDGTMERRSARRDSVLLIQAYHCPPTTFLPSHLIHTDTNTTTNHPTDDDHDDTEHLMAAPAHYIRSIHTSFTAAPHSLVAPRSASSAWTSTAQQSAYGGYSQPRRSSAGPKASLASGYAAGYNALGAAAGTTTGTGAGGVIMNTHNTHNYTHHLQNPAAPAQGQGLGQGQGYAGQTHGGRRTQGPQQHQGGRRRSVSIRMPPTYSYSSANPSALQASAPHPVRPVSPSQLSAAAPVFTPRQALIQEATSMAATQTHTPAPAPTPARREKPTYKFDPFADDDAETDVAASSSVSASVSSADALTSAFGPYELQTIHIPAAAPRDIARYSPAPSRSPSPPSPSPSLLTLEPEPLSAPPPTPKLSAAPLPSTTTTPPSELLLTSDPFATSPETPATSPTTPTGTPTLVNRPRDDYLARIVAGLLLQRQMSGRPRRRAVYAPGCGGVGMYRKSRLSAGWVGAGVGEA